MQHYINVIARSDLSAEAQRAKAEATKQSNLSFCCEMDYFACARNDDFATELHWPFEN
jgi:hypothetical protein